MILQAFVITGEIAQNIEYYSSIAAKSEEGTRDMLPLRNVHTSRNLCDKPHDCGWHVKHLNKRKKFAEKTIGKKVAVFASNTFYDEELNTVFEFGKNEK